ncbi:NAD(P)/FAD-dependent oxidoreductase [Puia sp.]|uniref:flavin-containing monooxygenase n=1 Tax=Puia sp. TaxID=2045100 RepID=UPI002F3F1682
MQTDVLIIGASVAGLSTAAVLQKLGIPYTILEKRDRVGAPWHEHYHRLHLHTSKRFSHLPYKKFPPDTPRYPSRRQVIDYLEDYRRTFGINPRFDTEAASITREGGQWHTVTNNGDFRSTHLVMATGAYSRPNPVEFKGIETFPGKVLHSSQYKTGSEYKGRTVLVVGFGNSACEIAIDLYEQGATPVMSVRSPVNVVPRDVFGISVLELSYLLSRLPPRVADRISGPLMKGLIGDLSKLGLERMPYGPLEAISRDGNPPVLDIGTIKHIRQGHITVRPGIDHLSGSTVVFRDGQRRSFDAIIAAIGYYRDYDKILHVDAVRFADLRLPAVKQKYFGADGLYFCGYWISPTGQFRCIASDARLIGRHIARHKAAP